MGACFVTKHSENSPVPILFEIGDYNVMYRGEKFRINYDPTALKRQQEKLPGGVCLY